MPRVLNHTFAPYWLELYAIIVGVTTCSDGFVVGVRQDQGAELRLSVSRDRHEASGETCPFQRETKDCPFGILIQQSPYFCYSFMDC